MEQHLLPCFQCGKELQPAFRDVAFSGYNQPFAGTVFRTHGHYGSTVFDPFSDYRSLELTICDECLIAGAKRVLYVRTNPRPATYDVKPWDPEVDE